MASNDEHFTAIDAACRYQVYQLKRKNPNLSGFHCDWKHDIYILCLESKPRYDAKKGAMSTYYGTIAANAASSIGRQISRDLQLLLFQGAVDLRLSVSPSNSSSWDREDSPLPSCAADWELANSFNGSAMVDFEIDFLRALSTMPKSMQALCFEICNEGSIADAQKASSLPRATFYGAKKKLWARLESAGFSPVFFGRR